MRPENLLKAVFGWSLLLSAIGGLALLVPPTVFDEAHPDYLLIIGAIGLWRYGVGIMHYLRGLFFLYVMFPIHRRRGAKALAKKPPSHIYLMVTSFRIDAKTTAMVYESIIREAMACGYPTTVVASIVEMSDELIFTALWEELKPDESIKLRIVRIPGTGKRDGLAYGFRTIARDLPDATALVAVVDGDTVLEKDVVKNCVPYFSLFPNVGALTTNEYCDVLGTYWMSQWHKLRFAQRHINMCSMSLSKRVLTLTGRMSMFRAAVVTQHDFIDDVESDNLTHWRLGQFKFLTGDDKSSWFSMMRQGWDTYYVPDAIINTVEHPPDKNFLRAARQLMFRWYGNSLRQNSRATRLGLSRLGALTYYVLWDQRVSMWTSILGLTASIVAAFKYDVIYLIVYLLWISLTRTAITLMLLASGHKVGPAYPIMLYFNQIFGSLVKIYVYFRLDRQSWTRQKTKLKAHADPFQARFNQVSTPLMTFAAANIFIAVILHIV
ncbi:glycosyltransferase family 2 protein [Echinimonas agarilytica]|uniref:Glycosyltransferase family 2 protein n=1 Tax=Echinimonas agarilytica TaxID=1215918 RepID=A0AA41WB80_9GAMM|nr:glycosyltransferase family 2 protein [Echinimonas agarilytica]MCM2681228.1 glycosyltransferase family 2 protein [Echinimonas agarilytica]